MPDHINLRDPVVISEFRISMATVLATVSQADLRIWLLGSMDVHLY